MKTIVLQRDITTEFSATGTKGVMSESNVKICDTLELHEEQNKKRESHIPIGTYLCKIVQSPKFGKVYEITNVPNRGNVLIHSANFAGDTDIDENKDGISDYSSDLLGCVAVGNGYANIKRKDGKYQYGIINSKKTLELFMAYMKGLPFYLDIRE